MPKIDHGSPLPLYYQLKQHISGQIATGELLPGQQLLGEHELCKLYGVSRTVVRQTLNELGYEGLIDKQRGKGTFVAKTKVVEGLISGLTGLADDVAQRGQSLESRVLTLREAPATASVAAMLHLEPGEPIVELERQRLIDGQPWVLVVTYLPAALVPGLAERDLSGTKSLYSIIRHEYKLPIISSTRRVEAAIADDREAPLLGIRRGDPVIVLRSISFTAGMRPLEYFVAHHRGDQSAFEVVLTADAGQQIAQASKVIRVLRTND
ncbi:MAG TPA: GntR family transcriptional regulator [Candidatus Baltobacterales bacterium]|nr:GntR family transcriptional regulator [Candidatus Baltobacterales bacterium]